MKYKNFIITKDKKFIFSYNPKVACTNWKCVLRYYEGFTESYLDAKVAHDRERSGLEFLSNLENSQDYLTDEGIKKFSFVRDPYSRIVSAYANKIEPLISGQRSSKQDNPYFYDIFKTIQGFKGKEITDPIIGFVYFLEWLIEVDDFHTNNEHWLPQSKLLDIENVQYDYVGRLENIDDDASVILKELGLDISFPSQKDVRFAPTNASSRLKTFLTKESVELINAIYSADFVNFKYQRV